QDPRRVVRKHASALSAESAATSFEARVLRQQARQDVCFPSAARMVPSHQRSPQGDGASTPTTPTPVAESDAAPAHHRGGVAFALPVRHDVAGSAHPIPMAR
ncbi:MAG: hypothetical protein ACK58T_42740, partial [Phycisphaerae bacterium]